MPGQEDRKPYKPRELPPDDERRLRITERKHLLNRIVEFVNLILYRLAKPDSEWREDDRMNPYLVFRYDYLKRFRFTTKTDRAIYRTILTIELLNPKNLDKEPTKVLHLSYMGRCFDPSDEEGTNVSIFSNRSGWVKLLLNLIELYERPKSLHLNDLEKEMTRLGLK